MREQLRSAGYESAVVQSFGATTDVLVRLAGDDPLLGNKVSACCLPPMPAIRRQLSASSSRALQSVKSCAIKAVLGMLLALAGIMVYVAFRFQWKFGFGAIVSLIHDVIVTLGVFSFFDIPFARTPCSAAITSIHSRPRPAGSWLTRRSISAIASPVLCPGADLAGNADRRVTVIARQLGRALYPAGRQRPKAAPSCPGRYAHSFSASLRPGCADHLSLNPLPVACGPDSGSR